MVKIPEIPESKPLAVIFLGIVLYIGTSYLNVLASVSIDAGILFGLGLIVIGIIAQIINWVLYFYERIKKIKN